MVKDNTVKIGCMAPDGSKFKCDKCIFKVTPDLCRKYRKEWGFILITDQKKEGGEE